MKFSAFNAVCDVEVGDVVMYNLHEHRIVDIRTIHYYVSGMVYFEFKLECLVNKGRFWDWMSRDSFTYNGR